MAVSTLMSRDLVGKPRSFTPPGDRAIRLSHLDPRPLWREPAAVESAWKSPSFWLAWLLVASVAGAVRLLRAAA